MRLPERHIKRAKEFTLIIIIIFALFGAAYVIEACMSDDIEAKNMAICPSDAELSEPEYKQIEEGFLTKPFNPLGLIPTWPDYIELDKDIWIEYPVTEFYQGHTQMYFPKGTKIYFKDKQ